MDTTNITDLTESEFNKLVFGDTGTVKPVALDTIFNKDELQHIYDTSPSLTRLSKDWIMSYLNVM
jgi:hypothetical protein